MNEGPRWYWFFLQIAAIAAGIYLGLQVFNSLST